MSAVSSPAPLADLAPYTDEAAAHLGESVVAACPMSRRGLMANKLAGSAGGWMGRALSKQVHKQRAGGLPETFILAVTDDEVVAIAYRMRGMKQQRILGDVAARWPRAGLQASGEKVAKYLCHLDLVPAGEDALHLSMGDWDGAPAFVALLNGAGR